MIWQPRYAWKNQWFLLHVRHAESKSACDHLRINLFASWPPESIESSSLVLIDFIDSWGQKAFNHRDCYAKTNGLRCLRDAWSQCQHAPIDKPEEMPSGALD